MDLDELLQKLTDAYRTGGQDKLKSILQNNEEADQLLSQSLTTILDNTNQALSSTSPPNSRYVGNNIFYLLRKALPKGNAKEAETHAYKTVRLVQAYFTAGLEEDIREALVRFNNGISDKGYRAFFFGYVVGAEENKKLDNFIGKIISEDQMPHYIHGKVIQFKREGSRATIKALKAAVAGLSIGAFANPLAHFFGRLLDMPPAYHEFVNDMFIQNHALVQPALYTMLGSIGLGHIAVNMAKLYNQDLNKSGGLVTDGFYRFTRNPMALTTVGIPLLAMCVAFPNPITILTTLYVFYQTNKKLFFEEKSLQVEFGEAYKRYKEETPRWVPGTRWLERLLEGVMERLYKS